MLRLLLGTLLVVLLGTVACKPCSKYRYSYCPQRCEQVCRSSSCGPDPSEPCTDDCDGPGSCAPKQK